VTVLAIVLVVVTDFSDSRAMQNKGAE